ncbi:glutathione binding-like protein [Litoribrevibacter albus]|uniref:GST C-terminal domain-containing protein n=1 Tax=Litoribrevibacter albus TaxID=1473156 RepID=A0AA37S6E5_9GAMM|nr:glutathione binding-like protein [Litoribrevibacter albus]GLQ30075.1 hypothetical protein GCM10007876_05530 [Litoribrevibacter albus]
MDSVNNHLLYATRADYYSAKIRAYLDYQSLPFDEVVPTQKEFDQLVKAKTGLEDCPVLITPDNSIFQPHINTIDSLEAMASESSCSVIPDTPVLKFVVKLIELYCDSFMYLPALYMRWGYDEAIVSAYLRLRRIYQSPTQAQLEANKERQKFSLFGLNTHNGPFFEYHAEQMVHILDKHFETHRYLLGDRLSLADLALMGPLFAHFYQDIRPRELLLDRAPNLKQWTERMIGVESGPDQEADAPEVPAWEEIGHIPETLYPLFQLIADDVIQFWKENLSAWELWASNDRVKNEVIPRFVSTHRFVWNAVSVEQPTAVEQVWQLQQLLDLYTACDGENQEFIENLLDSLDLSELLDMKVTRSVTFKDHGFYHRDALD